MTAGTERRFDVVILGSGPGGLAAAREIEPGSTVAVIDAAEQCGGAHRSHEIGPYTFDQGSFFFDRRHPWFDHLPDLRERMVPARRRQRRIDPRGVLRDYPFEPRELLQWPLAIQMRIAADYARNLARGRFGRHARNVNEAVRAVMGQTAFSYSGLELYVAKFNHADASQIESSFFDARMAYLRGKLGPGGLVRLLARGLRPAPAGTPEAMPLLVRPRAGFGVVRDALRHDLEERGVQFRLGESVRAVSGGPGAFAVDTSKGRVHARRLVSSIPVATAYRAVFGREAALASLDLLVLFVSCDLEKDELERLGNVLFNFHHGGRWKRLTIHSQFYDLDTDRSCFSIEITFKKNEHPGVESSFDEFREHVTSLGLMKGRMSLEGHAITQDAYPSLSLGSGEARRSAIDELERFGIELVGRQGRFDYLPTSNQVVRQTRERMRQQAS